jgi:hypothetical protein
MSKEELYAFKGASIVLQDEKVIKETVKTTKNM